MTTTTVARPAQPTTVLARPGATRALGVAGAAVAALTVWAVAVPLLGTQLMIRFGSGSAQTVGLDYVIGASLVGSLAGWGVLALLERRTPRARTLWTGAAIVVLLASLSLPLGFGTTLATKATLGLMHLVVAAVIIPTLRRTSRQRGDVGSAGS
jgi:hypothetical protein